MSRIKGYKRIVSKKHKQYRCIWGPENYVIDNKVKTIFRVVLE
jgi:hypothetical protein